MSSFRNLRTVLIIALAACCAVSAHANQVPDHNTLIVVSSTPDDSPVLSRLPYKQVPDTVLASSEMGPAVVANAAGVFANVSQLTGDQIKANPVFAAALKAGLPVVLTGLGDGRVAGEVVGLGVGGEPGEVMVVQQIDDNHAMVFTIGGLLEVVQGDTEVLSGRAEGNRGDLISPQQDRSTLSRIATADTQPQKMRADAATVTAVVTNILTDHSWLRTKVFPELDSPNKVGEKSDVLPSCPSSSCYQWYYTGSNGSVGDNQLDYSYSTTNGQVPNYDVRFIVTLHDSVFPSGAKFLTFHTLGHVATGGMYTDGSKDRGWFNEDLIIETQLNDYYNGSYYPDYTPSYWVNLASSSPPNNNDRSTLTTAESFTVGVSASESGGGVSTSYTASWSLARPLDDFRVTNQANTSGGIGNAGLAKWEYKMSASTGGAYNTWTDLEKAGCIYSLHGVPDMAKNNIQPATISIWDVPRNFRDWAQYRLYLKQLVRHTWKSGSTTFICDLSYSYSTSIWEAWSTNYVWIDYNKVHQTTP